MIRCLLTALACAHLAQAGFGGPVLIPRQDEQAAATGQRQASPSDGKHLAARAEGSSSLSHPHAHSHSHSHAHSSHPVPTEFSSPTAEATPTQQASWSDEGEGWSEAWSAAASSDLAESSQVEQVFSVVDGGIKVISTPAPSASASSGSASSIVTEDLLDNNYNAFTDDDIYLTATGFPPGNVKQRLVAGAPPLPSLPQMPAPTAAPTTPLSRRATTPNTRTGLAPLATRNAVVTTKYATSYLALGTGTCPTFVGPTKVASTDTVASWPAPSRSSVACTAAPSSFAGTSKGFSDLCAGVRYCDPPKTDRMKTTSLTGQVTRGEIESLLGQLQNVGAVLKTGISTNALSVGWAGQGAYGSGLLFEITGDIRALDNAVRIADNILALRNNPKTGRIMWTGKRELVWPTKPEGSRGSTYAGSENMSIIGNMVNAAIYILRNKCLWDRRPQWTNAPTTFSKTSTYLDRAIAYVKAADETMDSYFRPYWFNPQGIMIQPNSSAYAKAYDFPPGTTVAWNRRSLMLHGLIRLATAHEFDPIKDPVRVKRYDDLAAVNVRDFVANLLPTKSRGHQTYVWYYAKKPPGGTIEMVRGVHGFYDIWGMWIAWQRGIANKYLTDTVMQNLANTMQHQIYSDDEDKLFAAYVNGYANLCNAREQPIKYLWGAYAFYAHWMPQWYTAIATAGQAQLKLTWVTAPLLWAKAAVYTNSDSFWRASNYT